MVNIWVMVCIYWKWICLDWALLMTSSYASVQEVLHFFYLRWINHRGAYSLCWRVVGLFIQYNCFIFFWNIFLSRFILIDHFNIFILNFYYIIAFLWISFLHNFIIFFFMHINCLIDFKFCNRNQVLIFQKGLSES